MHTHVDALAKCSSSAVNTLEILHEIKHFWDELDWPDIESSYLYVCKIIDDTCRCCLFYVSRLSQRAERLGKMDNTYEMKFEEQREREWCLAVNNIEYLRQNLLIFAQEYKFEEVIAQIVTVRGADEAERCSNTLQNIIDNAIDNKTNAIGELIDIVVKRLSPAMRRFLVEGSKLFRQDKNSMERILVYLQDSFAIFRSQLNETIFDNCLAAIFQELSHSLHEIFEAHINVRKKKLWAGFFFYQ